MQINPMVKDAGSTSNQNSTDTSTGSPYGGGIDGMFMQLLITQLKNQDPLSPMDPSTFVNQLVGVSTLDQVSQINQLLQNNSTSSSGGH